PANLLVLRRRAAEPRAGEARRRAVLRGLRQLLPLLTLGEHVMPPRRPRALRVIRPALRRHPRGTTNSTGGETSAEETDPGHATSSIVDAALYRDGRRVSTPSSLSDTYQQLREDAEAMAWIGLFRPSDAELMSLAEEFGLHELAIEDAMEAHQRPKLERYGETLFVVLRAARYLDASEQVDFGELHLFVGPGFVITVRHGAAPDLSGVRRRMEDGPQLLRLGPEAVLYAILDAVVDGYVPVLAGVENDVDEIETEVFGRDPRVSRRIYELSREVLEFQRATRPLIAVMQGLEAGFVKYGTNEELQRYLRDVADHIAEVTERVDGFRQVLQDILTVNATLVTQQQNEEM